MKNYFFNPHDYDNHFTILTSSKEEALKILLAHMKTTNYYFCDAWHGATVDNLPDDYTIDEYEVDEVIKGENS